MYLKKIELAGFKSFADRTNVEFVPGITAIVGPNGSGKSNITDAMRWVLGEQSAKNLRGSKMEDVIFAGSDSRKPVNYSEVSLTLDNEDQALDLEYTEVTVTRRLYRSGESDYFINKQACRLKDITELFMDTGLGKEAYSIIGQGKIEEILSSKSEDRRGVFEEAAGIVKYKSRKKEAQKKLDDTEQNLLRIKDLIIELEGQLEPLEYQATKAKKYKELAQLLKELNIQTYVHDIEKTHDDWQNAEEAKKAIYEELMSLQTDVSKIDSWIEEKRWAANLIEKELEEQHQRFVDVSEEVERAEGRKALLKEREQNQESLKSQGIQAIEKLLAKKIELQKELDLSQEKFKQLMADLSKLQKEQEEEEKSLNNVITNHTEQIEVLKNDYFDLLNSMATLRNELRHLQTSIDSLQQRINRSQLEFQQQEQLKMELNEKLNNGYKELEFNKKSNERLSQDYSQLVHELRELSKVREVNIADLQRLQQKLEALTSRQEVLKEMQADFSGFQQGVKEILRYRDKKVLNGIHGAVAEVVKVPKKYELAVETALGGVLQYVIVNNEEAGRRAISFLKEKKLGRATFLPLDVVKGKRISEYDTQKLVGIDGYIGIAVDLIEVNPSYKNIVESYLGHVVVVTNIKVANEAAKLLGYRYRIVTIDGDVVNPGGSMTGGSNYKKNVNLIGRQREIDEINDQLALQKKDILKQQTQLDKLKLKEESLQGKLERTRLEGEQGRVNQQKNEGNIKQYEYELKTVEERIHILQGDLNSWSKDIEETSLKREALEKELNDKAIKEQGLKEKIELAEQTKKSDDNLKEESNKTITDIKINIAKLNQQLEGTNQTIDRIKEELNEVIHSIEQQEKSLIDLEQNLINQKENETQLLKEIDDFRNKKALLQKDIEEKRNERSIIIQQIEVKEAGIKESRKQLKKLEEGLHQTEVKLNRLDVELNNLLNKLSEEYEVSYEWAKSHVERVENIAETKKEVKSLKNEIQALGEVNLGAIEEFQRVSERFEFLSTQRTDLIEAKESLYHVIGEIEEEMSKRFMKSFEAIREQFQIVFVKLFGGGRADLVLTIPEKPLETGIEIIAQPPGKKLQNLALLSGGEKALTAITLLFAILRVKPVPFCVLDEVEAALDEANVTRFAEYLREFSEHSQFIVVTHRKGTMEGADVLYGVTMQESGVSRLVSVKLEEKAKAVQMV